MLLVENPAYLKRGLRMPPTMLTQRRSRGLGQPSSGVIDTALNYIPIVGSYNAAVTTQERNAAAAAEAPDNSPQMQAAITKAIAAGNDPTVVMNLWQNGASAVQMQLLASGAITPDKIVTPGTTPLTDAQLKQAFKEAGSGPPAPDPDWLIWLKKNGPWIGLGIGGLIVTGFVIREIL